VCVVEFGVKYCLSADDDHGGLVDLSIAGAGGGLGHLAIQYAQAQGLRVIAIDVSSTLITST
jgi:D-arabinose 1-dehydrogenase-like Zn-dependent alcohol dehydrogenase